METTHRESYLSGVSWGAIAAGSFVAIATYLALMTVGAALGLSVISPWSNPSVGKTLGRMAIGWLVVSQFIAPSLGGYIAGRLRSRWTTIHTNEVFFRDTAHGFVVWSVCLVVTAGFLASAAGNLINNLTHAGAAATVAAAANDNRAPSSSNNASNSAWGGPHAYTVDTLFRPEKPTANNAATPETRAEAARILLSDLQQPSLPTADKEYVAKLVASRADVSMSVAEQRVDAADTELRQYAADAKDKAEAARKAGMHLSLWIFLSLLVGAFCASCAAAIGGDLRDKAHIVTI